MVFKRYIKKNGKLHGPYYYKSYRECGKVKHRFLGTKDPQQRQMVALQILLVSVFFLAVFFVFSFSGSITGFVLSGTGTQADPYLVTNCTDLQEVNESLSANYSLTANIDCSDTINWNSGAGFNPIPMFNGTFDGGGYNITDLFINRTGENGVGLFSLISNIGKIHNLSIIDANVSGSSDVGILVGKSQGIINKTFISGTVSGVDDIGLIVGDLNIGDITLSYAEGVAYGSQTVGGLVGYGYFALIDNSYFIGNVTGTGSDNVGGIIGFADNTAVNNSYAVGNITGTGSLGGGIGSFEGADGYLGNLFSVAFFTSTSAYIGSLAYVDSSPVENSYALNYTDDDAGSCYYGGTDGCIVTANSSYFKGDVYPANEPMASWSFFDIWNEVGDGYPTLSWAGLGGDLVSPVVTITEPNATTYSFSTIDLEFSLNDTGYCEYSVDNGATNTSLTANASFTGFTWTTSSLSNAGYTLSAYCNNSDNVWNRTASVDFTVDSPTIVVTINSPVVNTYTQSSSIPIDIGINVSGVCNYSLDSGVNNVTLTANASNTGFTATRTFTNGNYNLNAYCDDDVGQTNNTVVVNFTMNVPAESESSTVGSPPSTSSETSIVEIVCEPVWVCYDWEECADGISTRVCEDLAECGDEEGRPIESQDCEEEVCTPSFSCGEWSDCNFIGDVGDILSGEIPASGSRSRTCVDDNSCIGLYMEEEVCSYSSEQIDEGGWVSIPELTVEIETTPSGESSLVTRNSVSGNPTSRISIGALLEGRLEIAFVQDEDKYPKHCFDAVMNEDEVGVDCGGSCNYCGGNERIFSMYPWIVFGLLVSMLAGGMSLKSLDLARRKKVEKLLESGSDLLTSAELTGSHDNLKDAMEHYDLLKKNFSKLGKNNRGLVRGDVEIFRKGLNKQIGRHNRPAYRQMKEDREERMKKFLDKRKEF